MNFIELFEIEFIDKLKFLNLKNLEIAMIMWGINRRKQQIESERL